MKKQKILIIENDPAITKNIKDMLKAKKYATCLIGKSSNDAFAKIDKHNPDLILMDIDLDRKNHGIAVVKKIRQKHDIPIVYIAAGFESRTIKKIIETEPSGYIIKPVNRDDLFATIEIAIHKYETEKKLERSSRTFKAIDDKFMESEQKYKALIYNIPGMVYKAYPDWTAKIISGCEKICGYNQDELNKFKDGWLNIIHNDDRKKVNKEGAKLTKKKLSVISTYRIITKKGKIRWVEDRKTSLFSETDDLTGIEGIVFDITERKLLEEELLKAKGKAEAALVLNKKIISEIPIGMTIYDSTGQCIDANESIAKQIGASKKHVLAQNFHKIKSWKKSGLYKLALDSIRLNKKTRHEFLIKTASGKHAFYDCMFIPFKNLDEQHMLFMIDDITERKEFEVRITKALNEKETLIKEIHHRVKNNMQIVNSLLNLQARQIENREAKKIFKESENRIRSMALIHEKLYLSDNLAFINFEGYLNNLIQDLYMSFGKSNGKIPLKLQIDGIILGIDKAIPCGLIINELVSNSLNHAFPEDRDGAIEIKFTVNKNNNYTLSFKDNGIGLKKGFNIKNVKSLGLKLIDALVIQLGGNIKIKGNAGTMITIRFPG